MDTSDVIAARYVPGFSRALTSWEVCIARSHWLRQKVSVYDEESPYHKQVLRFRVKLSRLQMVALWQTVERVGLREFQRRYAHERMCVTDCPSFFLTVRFADRLKEVEAYD